MVEFYSSVALLILWHYLRSLCSLYFSICNFNFSWIIPCDWFWDQSFTYATNINFMGHMTTVATVWIDLSMHSAWGFPMFNWSVFMEGILLILWPQYHSWIAPLEGTKCGRHFLELLPSLHENLFNMVGTLWLHQVATPVESHLLHRVCGACLSVPSYLRKLLLALPVPSMPPPCFTGLDITAQLKKLF